MMRTWPGSLKISFFPSLLSFLVKRHTSEVFALQTVIDQFSLLSPYANIFFECPHRTAVLTVSFLDICWNLDLESCIKALNHLHIIA